MVCFSLVKASDMLAIGQHPQLVRCVYPGERNKPPVTDPSLAQLLPQERACDVTADDAEKIHVCVKGGHVRGNICCSAW